MNLKKKFELLTYNIGFIVKGIDSVMLEGIQKGDIIWLNHPYKDRFFADPFLIKINENNYYILCEELTFWEQKGRIVLLIVDRKNYSLIKRKIIIDESTHLSFPYCEVNGTKVYPESSKSNKYYEYILDLEEFKVKEKKLILDEGTIDAIFYKNKNGKFLLSGKLKNPSAELYIYKLIDNKLQQLTKNSFINDNSIARSAGRIFNWRGKIYRPVQDCRKRYGHQTKIMELIELNECNYTAKEYRTINSFENPPFDETLHTFNVYSECILVDGSKDILRFPMKFFYRMCPFLFKNKL